MTTNNEAFEKFIEKHKHDFPQGVSAMDKIMFENGWQSATTEANKRMAELEIEVNYLKSGIAEELEQRILDLQASNNHLREALEDVKSLSVQSDDGYLAQDIAKKALQATPAESLQAIK